MNSAFFAFQAVPPASEAPTQAQTAQPEAQHRDPAPGGGLGPLLTLLIFVPFIIFLFWQSRSQQKKQETLVASLKKGDKVITQAGIVGRLAELDTRYARLEVAPGVKIQVLRNSLTGRDTGEPGSGKSADTGSEKP